MAEALQWDDIEQAARQVFTIWTDKSCEIDWAKHAWSHLQRAGLASYDNEPERCQVGMRFLALCNFYYDFVLLAWQEEHVVGYRDTADLLSISPCSVAALLARDSNWDRGQLDCDEPAVMVGGMKFLADNERESVVECLLEGFGQDEGLFVSLWRSRPDYHYEVYGEIMNDVTTDKMVAFEWINSRGCENLRQNRDGLE